MFRTLKIDTTTKAGRAFLAYAKTLSFVKVEEKNLDKKLVEKIRNAEQEQEEEMTSAEELREKLL